MPGPKHYRLENLINDHGSRKSLKYTHIVIYKRQNVHICPPQTRIGSRGVTGVRCHHTAAGHHDYISGCHHYCPSPRWRFLHPTRIPLVSSWFPFHMAQTKSPALHLPSPDKAAGHFYWFNDWVATDFHSGTLCGIASLSHHH